MGDRRLQVFHAVARHRNFTRAAQALFMSQSAVTFQIRQLEDELNVRLLDRGQNPIGLTPAGEIALSYAERILALGSEMETRLAEMTGEMRGTLRVGAVPGLGETVLPPLLAEFSALYPRVSVALTVANSSILTAQMIDQGCDVALIQATAPYSGVIAESCGDEELQLVCAPDHPLARLKEVGARNLRDHTYLARELGSGGRAALEEFLSASAGESVHPRIGLEADSLEAVLSAAAAGGGFAVVPRLAAERRVQLGSLCAVPLKPRLRLPINLIYPEDRFRSRLVSGFGEFLRRRLPEVLP